ncbi:MAG TPA: Pr6Pr family membrane protein [Pseudolysinimonas sp.]|nr:Pr6Pr family membrane protein [Pseudolysinimonas sp.]
MRALVIVVRVLGAAAIVAATVTQLINNFDFWRSLGIIELGVIPVNFFSYFTIDSNVLTVLVFLLGAGFLIRGVDDPPWFAVARASVVAYMAVTGIVYNTLLRGVNVADGLVVPWTNEILHVVGPVLIVLDWIFAPGRRRLEWKTIWVMIAFPLVWAVYTMIRGPLAYNYLEAKPSWYPYPFLNPANSPEGYVSVAFYVVLIAAIIGGVGAGVIRISRARLDR